ncbi:hypothetical protein SAMN05518672_107150 [Chitinophaga sp. CF118]|nr:hypothetical protein SAMN05518672_107150 [Chitinophaga sp. CF118]
MQEVRHSTVSSAHELLIDSSDTIHTQGHLFVGEKRQRFYYRTKALNDFNEHCIVVSSIRIKSLFVFICSHYKGYTQSYISVAVSLNNWRGPPTA